MIKELAIDMVKVPAGTFTMGSPESETGRYRDESPQHGVTIQAFFLGRYPITQEQWRVVAAFPRVEHELDPNPSYFKGDHRPVEQVNWYDAVEFCDRLSLQTGRPYRLPTEAEWEYACRAGTTTPFHFGETITYELANYYRGIDPRETTPVDHFGVANGFGLRDMHGNVREWCQDHWHENYDGAPSDESAWLTEKEDAFRIYRGGSWNDYLRNCRSAYRYRINPDFRFSSLGFRVACSA